MIVVAFYGVRFIFAIFVDPNPPYQIDPGNQRMLQLSSDPVLLVTPEGATDVVRTEIPARYKGDPFSGHGWNGPGVCLTFKSQRPAVEVYEFYASEMSANGWTARREIAVTAARRMTNAWEKVFPNGAKASLTLWKLDGDEFELSGSIDPVRW